MARGHVMLSVSDPHADHTEHDILGENIDEGNSSRHLRSLALAAGSLTVLALVVYGSSRPQTNANLVSGSSVLFDSSVEDTVRQNARNRGDAVPSMLVQAVLSETGSSNECDEACMMIKDRVKRAWTIGMALFQACGDRKEEGCGDVSKGMCDCEKKAGNVMCSELNYAWEELCPTTLSKEMHKGFCAGETITETRNMCQNLEYLPGVLINHIPGGQGGLGTIDDSFVHKTPEEGCSDCNKQPEEAPPAEAPAEEPDEGGAEGGEVASGMDASARRRA